MITQCSALFDDPVQITEPIGPCGPLVFASPHSGSCYPEEFLQAARLDALGLRRSEDCFVDELFAAAPAHGAPLLAARFPRAWCDANREAWELDPTMFEEVLPAYVNVASARVGAGLGTIARVVSSGEPIYRRKLRFAEAEARVLGCWQPYHRALAALVARARTDFGACLLIDCHSMPTIAAGPGGAVDVVLGDAHGVACAPAVVALIERLLRAEGFRVRRNDPYAGGYTTRQYGAPRRGVHVVQIELARGLYMDEQLIVKASGFGRLAASLGRLVAAVAKEAPALIGAGGAFAVAAQ